MKLKPARPIWPTTFAPQTMLQGEGRKDLDRVRRWAVRKADEDAGAHAVAAACADPVMRPFVSAVFSRANKNTFVEGAGVLATAAVKGAGLQLPAQCANASRALDTTRLLNIETARQLGLKHGDAVNGFYVATLLNDPSTGAPVDKAATQRQFEIYAHEGLVEEAPKIVHEQVAHAAHKLMPGIATWRPQFKLYFASPERIAQYRGEGVLHEEWLSGIVGNDREAFNTAAHEAFFRSVYGAGHWLTQLYTGFADEVTRRVAGVKVHEIGIEFRPPREK